MRIRFFAVAVLISSLFAVSCSQESPFLPVTGIGDSVTLGLSIPPGKIINPGSEEPIDISFSYDEMNVLPESLEVAVLDSKGKVIGDPEIIKGADLDSELPSIDTSSLPEGEYSVRLRVYDNDGQLLKEKITPFFNYSFSIQIRGVDVYPPEFIPGSSGFLFPNIDAPDSVWLRWSLGDSVISGGTLGSYRSGLVWKAPETTGVYTVKLEVFPFAPDSQYDFSSPKYTNVEIFVSDNVAAGRFDLTGGGNASVLLNLNGNLKDEGKNSYSPYFTGSPVPELSGSGFGYRLSSGEGISVDADPLPYKDDVLAPFTAVIRTGMDESSAGKRVLTVINGDKRLFGIAVDQFGYYTASLRQGSGYIVSGSSVYFLDTEEIAVSVIPGEEKVVFVWYADGEYAFSENFDYDPVSVSDSGTAVIGGDNGFSGFIDYFGVFPDLDDNIFNRKVKRTSFGGTVVFAEGFDGLTLPGYIADLNDNAGEIRVENGSAVISPGGDLSLFETEINFTEMVIKADLSGGKQGGLIVTTMPGGKTVFPLSGSAVTLKINPVTGNLEISGEKESAVTVPLSGAEKLKIGIYNPDQELPLTVASVLAYTGEKKVVSNN